MLRNSIDQHYKSLKGNNWLYDAAQPGTGFLQAVGCEKSLESVENVIANLATSYNHDKAIAELTFGFWTYQFGSKQFAAGGSTLLAIFPSKPFGTNHTAVFKKLTSINHIRNRIAHHEPVCFENHPLSISTVYARNKYNQILEVLHWLGIDSASLFFGVDKVIKEANYIDSL